MTDENLAEFPELSHQLREARRAQAMLEQVCSMLDQTTPNEPPGEHAQRLRGAAVVAAQAVAEIWVSVGWLEAVQAAEFHGLLERR